MAIFPRYLRFLRPWIAWTANSEGRLYCLHPLSPWFYLIFLYFKQIQMLLSLSTIVFITLQNVISNSNFTWDTTNSFFAEWDQSSDEDHNLPVWKLVRLLLLAQRHPPRHRRLLCRQRLWHQIGLYHLCSFHSFRWELFPRILGFVHKWCHGLSDPKDCIKALVL